MSTDSGTTQQQVGPVPVASTRGKESQGIVITNITTAATQLDWIVSRSVGRSVHRNVKKRLTEVPTNDVMASRFEKRWIHLVLYVVRV